MATADLATRPEQEPAASAEEPGPSGLAWDASVTGRAIGFGWDAEPLVVDWDGRGRPDLLVGLPREARSILPGLIGRSVSSLDDLPTVLLLENRGDGAVLPRLVTFKDGTPLVVGTEGCSPAFVPGSGGGMDLLVGSDDGSIHDFRRDTIRW